MAEVVVTIHGAARLRKDFTEYERRLRRPFTRTDATSRVVSYVNNEALRQITHGQHSDYARLSPRYAASKARSHPGRPILVRSGRTVRTLTDRRNSKFFKKVKRGGRTLSVGTKSKIAAYHQAGTKTMPARPLFRATRRVGERVAEIVSEALPRKRRGRGR